MLKWSAPLNPEKTLECLLETLYLKICGGKLGEMQTPEYINFRTRHLINAYPFDSLIFKNPNKNWLGSKENATE